RVVDRRVHDVDGAAGQPLALALRAFGEFELDLQATPGEESAIDRHIKRQRARGGEGVDVQQSRLRGICQQGEATEARYQGNRAAKHGSSHGTRFALLSSSAKADDPVITSGGGYSSAVGGYWMPRIRGA